MSKELKPCPFCGREAEYSTLEDEWGVVSHFVTCPNNCIEGLWSRDVSKEKAIEAWNNRPSPWHTVTPKEDGWYLVECQTDNFKFYATDYWNNEVGYWTLLNRVIRWQKIEPYEEATE